MSLLGAPGVVLNRIFELFINKDVLKSTKEIKKDLFLLKRTKKSKQAEGSPRATRGQEKILILFCCLISFIIRGLIWNIRGIINKSAIRRMKKLIKLHKLSFFAIIEPKAYSGDILDFQRIFACNGFCSNDKGSIWIFWKNEVQMKLIISTDQYIHMEMSHPILSTTVMLSFCIGSCDGREWRTLWYDLATINTTTPWTVAGDFNMVLSQDEKLGGCPINLNDAA